jgi:putative ABC transport system permease protein
MGHRLAGLFLARLDRADREAVAGDLFELHTARRAAGAGGLSASLAYWRDLVGVLASYRRAPAPHDPHRHPTGDTPMQQLLSDLRLAVRGFARAPRFTALAILTLGLGIGATTAMFSVLNPVLLQPLPYPDADRVVAVWEREASGSPSTIGYATYRDLRTDSRSLAAAAALGLGEVTLLGDDEPERLTSLRVSQEYFQVLGVAPALGRDFAPEEDLPGSARVAILSHGLWQRRFGGDPAILGRTVVMSDIPFTIIGLMPASFHDYLEPKAQLWTTLRYADQGWACRTCRHLRVVARLAPGVAATTAQRELDLKFEQLVAANPDDYASVGTAVVPLQNQLVGDSRGGLLAITIGVAFVLLIAVANVMNLQLGRALRRQGEFAIRGALGASRGQVMRQLLTENLLLALIGGGLGVLIAAGGIRLLTTLDRLSLPRLDAVQLDGGVLLFAVAVTVVTGILFGLAPAWIAGRRDFQPILKAGARGGPAGRHRLRAGLVVAEVSLALMLLVGAGLMMRSLVRLLSVNTGFRPDHLLTMEVRASGAQYDSLATVSSLADRVVTAVEALPGVEAAGWTSMLPLGGDFNRYGVLIASQPLDNPAEAPSADRYLVTPNYFATMQIPLLQGRGFTAQDRDGADRALIVNQHFANTHWAGRSPIGDRVQLGAPDAWWTIIGVAADVKHIGLDAAPVPQIYVPMSQWLFNEGLGGLVVRTQGNPIAAAEAVRRAIRALEPNTPISRVASMDDLMAGSTVERRYALWLFGGFAGISLLLAAAGIYGVLANSVQERTREIGIRSALGATRRAILQQVLGEGLRLTVVGLVLGGIGALALSRVLRGLLFGIAPHDPVTFVGVSLLLAATALAACWLPARRAASVPPAEVLRE